MRHGVRRAAAVLLPLVLAGCGTETFGASKDIDRAELKKRAGESALEHVYVTEIPGFTLAAQSVGVIGDDGFSGTYVSTGGGGQVQLSVDRGTLPADGCAGCTKDGDHWYSSANGDSAYLRAESGHVVRLTGSGGADRATVKAAAEKAHHASPEEMDEVLPEARSQGGAVVERGDLPPVGDGAPRNDVGASG
ncbi:hypothetical protein ACH4SP_31695 [Streptomyces sp. NPDC021093]|uniref:hypothetical protein n=1 Tax=Streptomyces sp. NPDC021093 TaxID=3365112 RepID=UPI0037943A15